MIGAIVKQLKDHISLKYTTPTRQVTLSGNAEISRNGDLSRAEYHGGIIVSSLEDAVRTNHEISIAPSVPDAAAIIEDLRQTAKYLANGHPYNLEINEKGRITITSEGEMWSINREAEALRQAAGNPVNEVYHI